MERINDFDELDEDATYCYHEDTSDDTTYTIELWDDLNEGQMVTLSYRDGYVSDLQEETFTEHIEDGKVFEIAGDSR